METTQRHPALPQFMSAADLPDWIRLNHIEQFTDQRKRMFTEEEKNDFEHESALSGREIKRLTDMKKLIGQLLLKGNDEPQTFTIPATLGTKVLERNRNQNYDLIERGYETEDVTIYAIPSATTKTMEFFTAQGEHVAERSRDMTQRELHLYGGIFAAQPAQKFEIHNGEEVDINSGEVLSPEGGSIIIDREALRTGTNG